jgi:hypothetical protein
MFMFMIILNGFLFMFNAGTCAILNEYGSGPCDKALGYQSTNSPISRYDAGDGTITTIEPSQLPSSIDSDVSAGGFSDLFNTFRNWISGATQKAKIMLDFVNAVPNFLKQMGFNETISFVFGFIWQAVALILLIAWLRWNI